MSDGEMMNTSFDPKDLTLDDFYTAKPYQYLYSFRDDPFNHDVVKDKLSELAKTLGFRAFKGRYEKWVKQYMQSMAIPINSVTEFDGQPIELQTGRWSATDRGITCDSEYGTVIACPHPIMPVERLVNVDTGMVKVKLAFRQGKRWRQMVTEKSILASGNSIIALSDYDVSVSSETARDLVRYFQDIEQMNYEQIPEKHSVARLGWISGHGFSPYVDHLIFDGDHTYRTLFESVKSHGSESEWYKLVSEIRRGSVTARVVLAASFASVLVEPCGCLPFFVHMWGSDSGTGKTVALMLAASVWACPVIGQFVQTFNSTDVNRERMASFFNSLPMLIDELQLAKNARGEHNFSVYKLAEGVGKGRGQKTGGVEKTSTWANTIITTGESPLVQNGEGAGAVNRVIDIECIAGDPVITEGHRISSAVKANYGFAGKKFVERLTEDKFELAKSYYAEYFEQLVMGDTTEKQAMAAALVLTADKLATEWIFQDDMELTVAEISKFLATKAMVSADERAHNYLLDWISQNESRFEDDSKDRAGVFDEEANVAYIIRSVFDQVVEEAGYSSKGFLSWLKQKDLITIEEGRNTVRKKIGKTRARCIGVKIDFEKDLADMPLDL